MGRGNGRPSHVSRLESRGSTRLGRGNRAVSAVDGRLSSYSDALRNAGASWGGRSHWGRLRRGGRRRRRLDGRRAGCDNGWVAGDVLSADTHEVRRGGAGVVVGTGPSGNAAIHVLHELAVLAVAVGVGVVLATSLVEPGVQAAWENVWGIRSWVRRLSSHTAGGWSSN